MKKSKKGFTLIELLAVIVILAIIALIAVPVIMNILNKSNKSVFRDTAYGIINAGELYYAEQQLDLNGMSEDKTFDLSKDVNTEGGLQLKGEIPSGKVSVTTEGEVAISIHNGRYYAKKDYDESEVEVYEIMYYSTFKEAVNDVNNDKIGENAIADQYNAVAGIYTDKNGEISVVLLKDTTETERITINKNLNINLAGNTIDFINTVGFDTTKGNSNKIVINGNLNGSLISAVSDGSKNISTIQVREGNSVNISNATILASTDEGKARTINNAGEITLSNSNIKATSNNYNAFGIENGGISIVSDSKIEAYANYIIGADGNISSFSNGIANMGDGILTVNNSYVRGTHAAVSNYGMLYVDGGTYEGFGQGGFYFSGLGTTSFVRNATIRECDMPEGYEANTGDYRAGFYIGGGENENYIKVYMDNNDIYGSNNQIVFRGASGEHDNALYISNSTINTNGQIRIDDDTHKLYIGAGNNFTAANTNLPSAVESTTDVYTRENFEQ